MAYSFKIKMWTDILKNNWQSWHKSAVTSVLQHSLFLYFFSKCPNKCKVPRNKMHITNETLISKKTKYYIFTEFTGPGNESKMWNLYTTQNTCADFWKHRPIALQGIKPAFLVQPKFPDWNNSFRCYFGSHSVLLC